MHGTGSLWAIERCHRAQAIAEGASPQVLSNSASPQTLPPSSLPIGIIKARAETPGFRHFLGQKGPKEEQRFTIDDEVFDPETMGGRADELMQKLVRRIQQEPRPNDPGIPSGYTYFLQLVAHDVVHSTIAISRNDGR